MEAYDFSLELNFTDTYKKYKDAHPAIREAMCLQQMYPSIFCGIEKDDIFAGRIEIGYAGFSPETGGLGYYCNSEAIRDVIQNQNIDKETLNKLEDMLEFWKTENTSYKVRSAYPKEVSEALPSDNWKQDYGVAFPLYRVGGIYLDYELLLENGISGLLELVDKRKRLASAHGEDAGFYEGLKMALNLFSECCIHYSHMVSELESVESSEVRKQELRLMASALKRIAYDKPGTLREAIQLAWLYALISGSMNYGRMDVYLGDFLARDLERGILTFPDAQDMIISFWQLIAARRTIWNGRVVIGGKGRRNEANADRFALLAIEATRVVKEIEPQLTLRFYKGMDERLMEKSMECIGEGRTYPLLYNDDVNIAAVAEAFRISGDEAEQYVPFGCGEYVIDHRSFGTPSGVINLLKTLEITLRNGRDAFTGRQIGLKTGEFDSFQTFDDLFKAYKRQVEYFISALARQEEIEYTVVGRESPFLYLSMLYDSCLENGKGIFAGGVKYLGGTVETYGNINTSDSLAAIRHAVYDEKILSRKQLIEALDANYHNYENVRKILLNMPKYGNDNDSADEMAVKVHRHVCNAARDQIKTVNLHSYLVVIINNSANTTLGRMTAASPDGRISGEPMANANNPSGGSDKTGLTALLNSLVKLDSHLHAGVVQNIKLSPELFINRGNIVKSLLNTYFENGGTQAMITVVKRSDLEKAMQEPQNYSHVFVRVGGFSARFIELEKAVQLEIISRTHY